MRPISLALMLALAACGGVPGTQPEPAPTTSTETLAQPASAERDSLVPPGSRPLAAVGDLLGEYRVAGIDGTEVQGGVGIALSIDGPRLSYEPTCAGFVWDIKSEGSGLRFDRAKGFGPERQPDGSFMACAVAVPPEYHRLAQAIDAARHVWRTPSNGILVEGGGRSVMLFSQ